MAAMPEAAAFREWVVPSVVCVMPFAFWLACLRTAPIPDSNRHVRNAWLIGVRDRIRAARVSNRCAGYPVPPSWREPDALALEAVLGPQHRRGREPCAKPIDGGCRRGRIL